ncbi:MAG: SlyX family protein [Herminiimonas sp.]|nr:SlyX family protein [Herminiimonas sp.]
MSDDRMTDIEIKLARQEDLVDTLNQMVYQQQKKIGELEALCAALARHLKALAGAASDASGDVAGAHDRPPHY